MYGWILQNAIVSGMLALAVAAVCRLGRFSPAIRHALWLIVLVKLVTPPIARYPVPKALDESWRWLASARLPQTMVESPTLDAIPPTVDVAETVEVLPRFMIDYESDLPSPTAGLVQGQPIEQGRTGIDRSRATGWLLGAWLVGAVVAAGVQVTGFVRLCRFLRQSSSAPEWLDRLVRQAAARLHVRPPEVAIIPALCSPMVCGLGRPRLLWPARLSDHLGREALEAVLLHELAHLRRRDHWVAWLEVVAGVIWWFDPVYWYARHQIHENAELACDGWVVALLPAGRRTYAHALVEVTEFVSSAPAAIPAVAMGNIARSSLERRLTMIMRESFSYRVPLIGSGVSDWRCWRCCRVGAAGNKSRARLLNPARGCLRRKRGQARRRSPAPRWGQSLRLHPKWQPLASWPVLSRNQATHCRPPRSHPPLRGFSRMLHC